jgi:sulfur-oxidizing protein SoxZ
MTKPRIKLPDAIKIGDIIEIKALISHEMETGQRRDAQGQLVPRHIIKSFAAAFNGQRVFSADLQPGLSANPYIAFTLKVTGPGDLDFSWTDDHDAVVTERHVLRLT